MKNIYGNSNNYKTKEDRLSVLAIYRKKLLVLLKEGFDPYQDNTSLYASRKVKQESAPEKIENAVRIVEEPKMTLKEGFDFGLKLKEKLINSTTKKITKTELRIF